MFLSIIICTRNRADEVVNCLPAAARQAREFSDVEVIVVDNGSTDRTREAVAETARELDFPFRYVYEPVAGLCQARNRGRAEARGRVLAYIDDDAQIGADWVKQTRESFLERDAKGIDSLTGKVHVVTEGGADFDFSEEMLWFFGRRDYGEKEQELFFPEHPIGCNMAVTTEMFDAVGGFDTNLKLYGDETEFFRRASRKGFRMLYHPRMEVTQVIPAERLTREELRQKSFAWGKGSATVWLLSAPGAAARAKKLFEFGFRLLYIVVSSLFNANFGKFFTKWYNYGYFVQLLKGLERR